MRGGAIVGLPPADWLSLHQVIAFVIDRCHCSELEAKDAVRQVGRDGRLNAKGLVPLSTHPDPKRREAHPPRRYETLRDSDWDGLIDWAADKIGPYSSVWVSRLSIEAWLAATPLLDTIAPAHTPASPQPNKAALRESTEAEYKQRLNKFLETNNRCPTVREDEEWRKGKGISRGRLRELRKLLPPEVQKGGAPKKPRANLANKPGQK